jgi:hypothetical protein
VTRLRAAGRIAGLAFLATLPLLPVLPALWHGAYLADPRSELPVRLWVRATFPAAAWRPPGWLGAPVDAPSLWGGPVGTLGWPEPGWLNNPDVLGSVLDAFLVPVCGDAGAWNLRVLLLTWANLAVATWLARRWLRDDAAAWIAGVGVAFAPLSWSYGVDGAISDVLQLWPWLGALGLGARAVDEHRTGLAVAAGALGGLGVIACPYHAPIVAVALVVGLPAWWALRRASGEALPPARLARLSAVALLVSAFVAAPQLAALGRTVSAEASLLPREEVAATRHGPPWDALRPHVAAGYTAPLRDYVTPGPDGVATRDVGSRYARSVFLPWTLLAPPLLALAGLLRRRDLDARTRRVLRGVGAWTLVALVGAVVAMGPFLVLAPGVGSTAPWNLAYLAAYRLIPGVALVLEIFRFAWIPAVAMSFAAAGATACLAAWRPATSRVTRWGMLLLLTTELAAHSARMGPPPVATPAPDAALAALDTVLPPGPVVALPFFDRGTSRFQRNHLLAQRLHGRPLADGVAGIPPAFLRANPATRALLALERPGDPEGVATPDPARLAWGYAALARAGFVGIVVDPGAYRDAATRARAEALLGPGAIPLGAHRVWRLDTERYGTPPSHAKNASSPASPTR